MDKLRQRQEVQAYRIVRRNVIDIVKSIPISNMSINTYKALIHGNISESQIRDMFKQIYTKIGEPQYKRAKRQIKSDLSFSDIILQFLITNGGEKITSVHNNLIDSVINVIEQGYANNKSVIDIAKTLQNTFGWYKPQALRIARTETTTATNYATVVSAQNSDYVLEKTWISAQDNRTRRPPKSMFDHYDMNGQKVPEDRPFFVGGEEINYPGDPKASAGNTINCRCKVVFTIKEDEFGLPIRKKN